MKKRETVLNSLLALERPLNQVLMELRAIPWDSHDEIVVITRAHVSVVLRRFIAGELRESEVEDWANAIEGRDDIGFTELHAAVLKRVLHELANPALEGALTNRRAIELDRHLVNLAVTQ